MSTRADLGKELAILSLKKRFFNLSITMEDQQKRYDEAYEYLQKLGQNGGYVSSDTYMEYSYMCTDLDAGTI